MSDCPTDTPKSVHASITSFKAWPLRGQAPHS